MDNNYLEQLISEAENRGGGMMLNLNNKPAAVVLTVDRYNQLVSNTAAAIPAPSRQKPAKAGGGRQILVTGGAGYIGAHLVRQLLAAGFKVTVIDNLSTGRREHVSEAASFVEGDLADLNLLRDLFASHNFEAVCHLAASIEVEESVNEPGKYYDNNVTNMGKLLLAMNEAGVKNILFSSSAAVYGEQQEIPIAETADLVPNNPYGATKLLGEQLIKYFCDYAGLRAVVFRYFNACGCDYDGKIKPTHESHLMPVVLSVACGQRPYILVNGNNYETFDGTCVRDYVHVLDIAAAHVVALDKMGEGESLRVYNIGSGKGLSVLQIINAAAETLNRIIPMEIGPRRAGDPAALVADSNKIARELGFRPQRSDVETIISTSWHQMTT